MILAGIVPFYFFHARWTHAALAVYLTTAFIFGMLLEPDYPPPGTSWFWKSLAAIIAFHVAVTALVAWGAYEAAPIGEFPRAFYGLLAFVVFGEWRVMRWIIDRLEPAKRKRRA